MLTFAEYLAGKGDYVRAAGEYERYLALVGPAPDVPAVLVKAAACYRLAGDEESAIRSLREVVERHSRTEDAEDAVLGLALIHQAYGRYEQSLRYLDDHPARCEEHMGHQRRLRVTNLVLLRRWGDARQMLEGTGSVPDGDPDHPSGLLGELAAGQSRFRRKRPAVAVALSAIMPGAGKFYAGRPRDGLVSLSLVGMSAWQAHRAFRTQGSSSAKGWAYTLLSLSFYAGNLYGSAVEVRLYNERADRSLVASVRAAFDTPLR